MSVVSRVCTYGLRIALAWCFIAIASSAAAQVAGGSITGVVTDQAHATVPGATVTVTNVATNVQRVVTSTTDGVYTAPGLAPGTYQIDVELQGFRPLRREGVCLATARRRGSISNCLWVRLPSA